MQPAYDLVLVVPNEARTNANLQVDFAAAKSDVRILTIVAGQRRNHQVFESLRRQMASGFDDAGQHVRQLLDQQ